MSDSSNPPTPKRTHRFRNTMLALCAGVLLLLSLHAGLRQYEYSRLMGEVKKLQSQGEPVLPGDFRETPLPDGQNPVVRWRQAATDLDPRTDELERDFYVGEVEFPLTSTEAGQVHQITSINGKSLDDVAAAAKMTGLPQWHIQITSPAINILLPDLNQQRRVATVLRYAIMDAHQHGDDAAALAHLRELLSQSRALFHHTALVGHLVAIGISAMADDTIRKTVPDMHADAFKNPAVKDQARKLIAELLDDGPQRQGQQLAFRCERMFEADSAMCFADGTFDPSRFNVLQSTPRASPAMGYFLSPIAYGDGVVMLQYTTKVLEASQAPDWPACEARMPKMDIGKLKGDPRHIVLSILMPAFDRALQQDYRLMTENRLSAVLLAAKLYAADHDGHLPDALDELGPMYLPAPPGDPMTAGKPLKFRGGADPIVYSAGENGIDDRGSEAPTHPGGGSIWFTRDAVVHLKLQPRQTPPQGQEPAPPTEPATTTPATQSAASQTQ